jgi:hypothetical protein
MTPARNSIFATLLVAGAIALPVGCGGESGSGAGGTSTSSGPESTSATGGTGGTGGSASATTSTSAVTSTSAGSTTSATSTSTASSTSATSSTGTGGMDCPPLDPGEPNDGEGIAYDVGMLTCKDSDLHSMLGTLTSPADEDWFVYQGADTIGCLVNPTVTVVSSTAPVEVCSYFFCHAGTAKVVCPAGTITSSSSFGDPGCCGTGSGYTVNLDCTGTTDGSADVFLAVEDPTGAAICTDYELSFHY